ncbi:aspartic peptidase domain-containing protein [Dipodascopsis tothii]|uniref:aspartic peptidase domain-containing protein n=1 Tax=Dipodascopsis tothii TaxID=44089 RepID=UPI0034CFC2DA
MLGASHGSGLLTRLDPPAPSQTRTVYKRLRGQTRSEQHTSAAAESTVRAQARSPYMKIASILAAASLAASAAALPAAVPAAKPVPGVLSLDITGQHPSVVARRKHRRRMLARRDNGTVTLDLENDTSEGAYLANVTLGTPAQTVHLQLDTGSSDVWAQSSENTACDQQDYCEVTGTFDQDESSTFSIVNNDFSISYADSSYARGDYASDTFGFGGVEITNFTFGLALNATSSLGVMGIGFAADEASATEYDNLPDLLVSQGLTNVRAYSLWLNDLDSSEGQILFGGIDRGKFSGSLTEIDIEPTSGTTYAEFLVMLTGVWAQANGTNSTVMDDSSYYVVLDSGTTYSLLPTDIVEGIAEALGSSGYNDQYELYMIDCDNRSQNVTIQFELSDEAYIEVSADELIVTVAETSRGDETCAVGLQAGSAFSKRAAPDARHRARAAPVDPRLARRASEATDTSTYILGDTFLRSAYVVYNLDSKKVSLAQTAFNSDKTDIVVLTSSSSSSSPTGEGSSSSSSGSAAPVNLPSPLWALAVALGVALIF